MQIREAKHVLTPLETKTAFDVFGSDLPDEAFVGVFDQPRQVAGARSTYEVSGRYEHNLRAS
jgi:hypothetical protein